MINYFGEVFGAIWQNSVFHWAIFILLDVAIWQEYKSVKQYQRYHLLKSRIAEEAITYLSKKLEQMPTFKGKIELFAEEISLENWQALLDWFSEYLVGNFVKSNDAYIAEVQGGRFLMLQYPPIITRSIPRSKWRFVPSLLIAIGVLGTFYGIQTGLQNISLGDLGNNTQLLPSISQLIEGMKTAFSTSLMGLASASLVTIFLVWCEGEKQKLRNNLQNKLDKIGKLQTRMQILSDSEMKEDAVVAINKTAEIMRMGFSEMVEAQHQLMSQIATQEQQKELNQQQLEKGISELHQTIASTNERLTQLESLIEQSNQVISQQLEKGITQLYQAIASTNERLKQLEFLTEQNNQVISQQLEKGITQLYQAIASTNERLKQLESLTQQSNQVISQQLEKGISQLHQTIASTNERLKQLEFLTEQSNQESLQQIENSVQEVNQTITSHQTNPKSPPSVQPEYRKESFANSKFMADVEENQENAQPNESETPPYQSQGNFGDVIEHGIMEIKDGICDIEGSLKNTFQELIIPKRKPQSFAKMRSHNWQSITLIGHSSGVSSVAISFDGKMLASGSEDTTVKIWRLDTGKEICTLGKNRSDWFVGIKSVAFSPNGKIVAAASDDKTIKLWNLSKGKEIFTLIGHSGCVKSIVFSPDGQMLISGSDDKTIKVWQLKTGKETRNLTSNSDLFSGIKSVAISQDGKMIATGGDDKSIKLWELANGEVYRTLSGHSGSVKSIAFSPTTNILASGSDDKTIKIWQLDTGKEIRTLEGHLWSVSSVTISSDGQILVSSSQDNTIKLWHLGTGKEICTLREHSGAVNSVAISPDGRTIVSGSDDKTIKIWRCD